MPSCNLEVVGPSGATGSGPVTAEVSLGPLAPVGSSAKFVPAYGIVQPKDFAFYWQQQLGIFHVFYIVSNRVVLGRLGADSTEKTLGHAWSADLVHWHALDSVLTVRADKWDNLHIWAPTIVQKDLQFKLFYTGVHRDASGNDIQETGLATADATLPNDSLKTWTRRDSAVFYCRMVPWANKNTSIRHAGPGFGWAVPSVLHHHPMESDREHGGWSGAVDRRSFCLARLRAHAQHRATVHRQYKQCG
jgi:hypothetical protein